MALAVPALQLRIVTPGPGHVPEVAGRGQDLRPHAAGVPRAPRCRRTSSSRRPNVDAPAVRQAIGRLERDALASGRASEPITVDSNADDTVANITIPIVGTGPTRSRTPPCASLRERIVPQTVGALPNAQSGVTGLTAEWKDAQEQMKSKLPLVVAFVLVFAFGLMLVAFRSIVVAAKAIVLNLLSVAAAYGVLVLVFQHGFGKGLLGFSSTAGIAPVVPMLLFVILFGLSMDYHVFIVSRIRETFDRGASMDDAIAHGHQVHRRAWSRAPRS